ncbi:MAG: HD domain-containing protein [Candidatus Promineifilaceae bacterium]
MVSLQGWESQFETFIAAELGGDAVHGLSHIQRVVSNARRLAVQENANLEIVLPAAWLHDCVSVPKNSPQRSMASRLAATRAGVYLRELGYEEGLIPAIEHAIAAHSFSAEIPCETIEAQVVQDADRLDAIGAIGIARTLLTGASMGAKLYHSAEPFATSRPLDDKTYSIDHFYVKLLKLESMIQTDAGKAEAKRRTLFMHQFLDQLRLEL